jgi:hypothetical protein
MKRFCLDAVGGGYGCPVDSQAPDPNGGAVAVAVPDQSGPPAPSYPAAIEISYPAELNRWMPLVKWLLAFPHYIALFFVGIGALFVLIYAFFVVTFTGRWPRGAFDYVVGTLRWGHRVTAYVYLMTDVYPPFSLEDDPQYPVRVDIEYPDRQIDNWRPIAQWFLAIPYLFIAGVIYYVTMAGALIAFFTVLFTKQIPRGIFELMLPGYRWALRGYAYAYFMVDQYPPWVWG